MMGGSLDLASTPGQGSRFSFVILMEPAPVQLANPPWYAGEAQVLEGRRVLIVDDNATNRLYLHGLCRAWAMVCEEAVDGPSALERLAAAQAAGRSFDLVLLDRMMPDMDGFEVLTRLRADPVGRALRVVMQTSMDEAAEGRKARTLGADDALLKPVRRRRLLESLSQIFGGAHPRPAEAARPPERLRLDGCCVLVVEDNNINQQVLRGILHRAGCQVLIANDGAEALEILTQRTFDVVLMDREMPVLDGIATTRALREHEHERGGTRHQVVVALTAHTFAAERERCLAAGMDDFLTKPIRAPDLLATLDRWWIAPRLPAPVAAPQPPPAACTVLPIDPGAIEDLREAIGDIAPVLHAALADVPARLAELRLGVETAERECIRSAAHALAGSVGNLGAHTLVQLARDLEALGKSGNLSTATELLAALQAEAERFLPALAELLAAPAAVSPAAPDRTGICERDRPYRALVVDDSTMLRTAIAHFLIRLGFEVQTAHNGQCALDLFQARGADLVLLDAAMPVMNGFSACEAIRAIPAGRHVPVIMITSYADEASVNLAFASGATDYVTKPIHWAVLRNRVRQLAETADAERHLRQDHAFFQSLVDAIPEPTLVCDREGVVRWINQDAGRFPLLAQTAVAAPLRLAPGVTEPDAGEADPAGIIARIRTRVAADNTPVSLLLHGTDLAGGELYTEVHARALSGVDGTNFGLILRLQDVTARELEERHLRRQVTRYGELAHRDSLTGVANRRRFEERLNRAVDDASRSGDRLAVLFLDLDGFKAINDTRGHAVGDQVLCQVAARLQGMVRRPDLVARLGGDEFAVLVCDASDCSEALELGERLLAALCEPMELTDGMAVIGASIGVSLFPEHGPDEVALMHSADEAMYAVKRRGKRGVMLAVAAHKHPDSDPQTSRFGV
ncbi:response regulator [uncultured Thiodictyon sp.]|uniref:response regulator n=1 Tax=uncultured Thiodictyon sp. TaxID=1846217 RepID=UPI00342B9703